MRAKGEGKLGRGEIEQKGKMTYGHGQQCGDSCGQGDTSKINGNVNYNKD